MSRLLHRLAAGALLALSPLAAYDTDTHYFVTYYILRDSGFTEAQARGMASIVEYVDLDSRTDATPFRSSADQRRLWHFTAYRESFPSGKVVWGRTVRNNPWGRHNINVALIRNDLLHLAIALHAYQDTYSHEGYEAFAGHAIALHTPDVPVNNLSNFKAMVTKVYAIVAKWRRNNGLPAVARTLDEAWYEATARRSTPSDWRLFVSLEYFWNRYNLQPRIDVWRNAMARFGNPGDPASLAGWDLVEYGRRIHPSSYALPDADGPDLRKEEWAAKGPGSPVGPAADPGPAAVEVHPEDEALVARIQDMPLKWGVRALVTEAPHLCLDGRVQARLANEPGLGALLDLAPMAEDPALLATVLGRWDLRGIDLAGLLEDRLDSSQLRVRLFCASMLSGNFVVSDLCAERIRGVYQEAAGLSLTPSDRAHLLACLPTDPAVIATKAPAALDLYRRLLDDPDLAPAAAAALFRTAADGEELAPSPERDAVRQSAAAILQAKDPAAVDAGTRYWMIRSYEDFDNAVTGSATDRARLQKLLALLQRAAADGDEPALQAAAIALASYDPRDNPDPALIAALRTVLASPAAAGAAGDLNYALQHLTGGQDF